MNSKNFKKIWSLVLVFIFCFTILSACGTKNENNVTENKDTTTEEPKDNTANEEGNAQEQADNKLEVNIGSLKGPTSMGLVKLMDDYEDGDKEYAYSFTIAGTADVLSTALVKGELDIAAIPSNLASVLYNQTNGEIVIAGINTLGVLYILETGDSIKSVNDLKGKTVYSMGKGTTPEYTLNYLLSANGIDAEKDLKVEYKSEATEVAALLSESDNAVAMLPQPYVTTVIMNNNKVRIALDITKEWEKISEGSTVVTGVIAVRKEFLDNNKEAVDAFLNQYEESAKYVNDNVEDAAELIEKFDIFKADTAKEAIPLCNITSIRGEEMKTKVDGYLKTLFDQNPKTIGGAMPGDDFYYLK